MAGVYTGAVSVQSLLQHGDSGLGAFASLDGEMVVLQGRVYQVQGTGRVFEALPTARVPFAVMTKFSPETDMKIASVANLSVMANAFRAAESGRPGAAYVNLPKDIMATPCAHDMLSMPAYEGLGPADSTAIGEAAHLSGVVSVSQRL